MNICEVFIRRPIATALIMMAILIFGIAGYLQLPVSDLPNVDYPTINVGAGLPGADPRTQWPLWLPYHWRNNSPPYRASRR